MEKGLKVLLVASESAPFVKSGGLGDVVGSLPKALQKKKWEEKSGSVWAGADKDQREKTTEVGWPVV